MTKEIIFNKTDEDDIDDDNDGDEDFQTMMMMYQKMQVMKKRYDKDAVRDDEDKYNI